MDRYGIDNYLRGDDEKYTGWKPETKHQKKHNIASLKASRVGRNTHTRSHKKDGGRAGEPCCFQTDCDLLTHSQIRPFPSDRLDSNSFGLFLLLTQWQIRMQGRLSPTLRNQSGASVVVRPS